jgi:hypothetical protein
MNADPPPAVAQWNPKSLAVTDHLVEINRPTWDLADGPVADRSTESRQIHVLEEVAEG